MTARDTAPILFRADANAQIGVGHVMRCLAIAEALQARGATCRFASRALPTGVARRLSDAGIARIHLPEDVPPLVDAAATLAGSEPDSWIVCDGYGFDAAYRRALMSCGNPLLAIDDGQPRESHPATIILNPNVEADASIYAGAQAELALGLAFVPLRKNFWQSRKPLRATRPRIVIAFGGADPDGLTAAAAQALAPLSPEVDIVALVGPANPRRAEIEAALPPGLSLLTDVDDMAALLASATLVIAAAGVTLWEAMASGAAVIGVHRDPLQKAALDKAASLGLLGGAFEASRLEPQTLLATVKRWIDDPAARHALVAQGLQMVDGKGALRCADLLLGALKRQAA
jgi:UDP-2,4-diacetamido-2,4,6-trideoxy-beta-L-altropyranose hydrolase